MLLPQNLCIFVIVKLLFNAVVINNLTKLFLLFIARMVKYKLEKTKKSSETISNSRTLVEVKYSLKKQIKKQALVELFMMLSDSMDENIPDIVWEGSEFEVNINQDNLTCDIGYISTKKGGEFSISISWITEAAKKAKEKAAAEKTKEKLAGKTKTASATKKKAAPAPKSVSPAGLLV